jgi:uncharacterized membrane protein
MSDLGTSGETSAAHGINNRGEIVGAISSKNVRGSAVLWKNRQRLSLADLGPTGSGSTAFAVNANGDVTGVSNGFVPSSGGVVPRRGLTRWHRKRHRHTWGHAQQQ